MMKNILKKKMIQDLLFFVILTSAAVSLVWAPSIFFSSLLKILQKKKLEIIKKILISPSNHDSTKQDKQKQRIEEFMKNLIIYYLTYFPINMIPEHLKNNTKNIDKLIDGTLAREIKTLPTNRETEENKLKILEALTWYEINNERGIEFILRSLCSIKLMKYIYEEYDDKLINMYLLKKNHLLDENKLLRYFSGLIFGIVYGDDNQKDNEKWDLQLNFTNTNTNFTNTNTNTNFTKMNEHIFITLKDHPKLKKLFEKDITNDNDPNT